MKDDTLSELNRLVEAGFEIKVGAFKGKETTVWSAHIALDDRPGVHRRIVHHTNPASALEALVAEAEAEWPGFFGKGDA